MQGIDQIKNEVEDLSEPLIDGTHGHGRSVANEKRRQAQSSDRAIQVVVELSKSMFMVVHTVLEHVAVAGQSANQKVRSRDQSAFIRWVGQPIRITFGTGAQLFGTSSLAAM